MSGDRNALRSCPTTDSARCTTALLTDTVTPVDDPDGGERALWDRIR